MMIPGMKVWLAMVCAVVVLASGCSNGSAPPVPQEDPPSADHATLPPASDTQPEAAPAPAEPDPPAEAATPPAEPEAPADPETPEETEAPDMKVDLSGTWNLVRIGDEAVPEGIEVPNLTFEADGTVQGFAGVNRIGGSLQKEGDLLFGPLMMTRMAGPEPAMTLEMNFSAALSKVTQATIEGDTLTLSAPDQPDVVFSRG